MSGIDMDMPKYHVEDTDKKRYQVFHQPYDKKVLNRHDNLNDKIYVSFFGE
jgi:hypothetical protein